MHFQFPAPTLPHIKKFLCLNYRFLIYFLVANGIFIVANIPFWQRIKNTPPGYISTYQHHDVVMDYPSYINYIRQAKDEGLWKIKDSYTLEPTSTYGSLIYYILLGKIDAIFNIDPTISYHLARLIEYEIFIYLVYLICVTYLGKSFGFLAAFLSFIIGPPAAIGGSTLYNLASLGNLGVPAWWMLNPFRRVDMLPHHEASAMLLIIEIYLLLSVIKKFDSRKLVSIGIAAFFATLFHPISAMVFVFGQPFAALINLFTQYIKSRKLDLSYFWLFFIPFACSGIGIFLMRYDLSHAYPYNLVMLTFDVGWYDRYVNYVRDYFIGGSLLFIFGVPISFWIFNKYKDIRWKILITWVFISYIFIPFSTQLHAAKFRFALLLPYLPFSIIFMKFVQDFWGSKSQKMVKLIGTGLITGIILIIIIPSIPVMYNQWNEQMSAIEPGMYISTDLDKSYTYLKTHAPINSHILCGEINGLLIPTYTPDITFIGQYNSTIDYEEKKYVVRNFFGGIYTPQEAANLVNEYKVNYIIYSPEEQSLGPGPEKYGLSFEVWYKNTTVTIFKVI
jgi:hypothetical protein